MLLFNCDLVAVLRIKVRGGLGWGYKWVGIKSECLVVVIGVLDLLRGGFVTGGKGRDVVKG